jgi:alkanesulfonate monooxygenase SsuD/methylene tetrahydromethanopterin reductase-like flavin-dependent oxidoreductase (luciferase family)
MKFGLLVLPTIPGTLEERKRLRPIAAHNERWQMMIKEIVEFARMAEDLGVEMLAFPEHHLNTEGVEMGSVPQIHLYVAMHTKRLRVGPIGYVLPGWNPLRLAIEIGWLDQLTQGRTFVGFARGYQHRWLNQMGQKLHVSATTSDQSDIDRTNRKVFEEVFQILKLAWGDEPFSFKGDYYEYPYPYETGTPWPPHEFTAEYGAPGEIENGYVKKIFVVPKPYQRPHPPLFQAFSISDETIIWCARQGIIPMTLVTHPQSMARVAKLFQDESAKTGRKLELGQRVGVLQGGRFPAGRDRHRGHRLHEVLGPLRFFRGVPAAGGRGKISTRQGDASPKRVERRPHGEGALPVHGVGVRYPAQDG